MDDCPIDVSLLQQELSKRILRVGVARILPDCLLKRGFRRCCIARFHRMQPALVRLLGGEHAHERVLLGLLRLDPAALHHRVVLGLALGIRQLVERGVDRARSSTRDHCAATGAGIEGELARLASAQRDRCDRLRLTSHVRDAERGCGAVRAITGAVSLRCLCDARPQGREASRERRLDGSA